MTCILHLLPTLLLDIVDDVAGIDSSLAELYKVISYIRNPTKFREVGACPPKGILLHGPPGSGKTLLARTIAGEAERTIDGAGGNAVDCFAVCSGSEFVETYVGRGAARVRSLFRNAREEAQRNYNARVRRQRATRTRAGRRNEGNGGGTVLSHAMSDMGERMADIWEGGMKQQQQQHQHHSFSSSSSITEEEGENTHRNSHPMAILFIDEIDALAKRRDSNMVGFPSPGGGGGGCDEREQTLNQLLTEMDGFATGGGNPSTSAGGGVVGVTVIVIAATNRPEVLDPAILRPGRFDRHVRVPLPDARGCAAILNVHARSVRWKKEKEECDDRSDRRGCVYFGKLRTDGFSGADLKNVINEAALLAVRKGRADVDQDCLMEAVERVRLMMGGVAGSR